MLTHRRDKKYVEAGVFHNCIQFSKFSFIDLFHFFVLASAVVNQKANIEADVMIKIEIDGVLKYAPDKIAAEDRGKIYMIKINQTVSFNNCDARVLSFLIILSKPVRIRLKFSGIYVFDTFYKCRLKAYNWTPRLKLI